MLRKSLVLVVLLATVASARTRSVTPGKHPDVSPNGATVTGVVDSVDGTLVKLADGHVAIEAKDAKIVLDRGHAGAIADIQAGMILFATLTKSDIDTNAPLPASMITLLRVPDATLFGPVQDVDVAQHTLEVLGRTIHVTDETSIGGVHRDGKPELGDIQTNQIVQVATDAKNGQLVASSIIVLAPAPPQVHRARGDVKTIGADAWVIETDKNESLTLTVDAHTKIVGAPKVGDTVEVLYRIDSAHALVAISIVKFEMPTIPATTRFHGPVKSIEGSTWVVKNKNEDFTFLVTGDSKVEPGIKTGDVVDGLAAKRDDGAWVALVVIKAR